MEYQRITNLLVSTIDKVPTFITKTWIEIYDLVKQMIDTNQANK